MISMVYEIGYWITHVQLDKINFVLFNIFIMIPKDKQNQSISKISRTKTSPSPKRPFLKEIIIKTEEPDIPEIKILKTQTSAQHNFINAIHSLEQLFVTINSKKVHQAFFRISQCRVKSNMSKIKAREIFHLLNNRLNKFKNFAWLKMVSFKNKENCKRQICRLVNKTSENLLKKMTLAGFFKLKMNLLQRDKKEDGKIHELSTNLQKIKEKYDVLNESQFSQKFLAICSKLQKFNPTTFSRLLINELEPVLSDELKILHSQKKGNVKAKGNETVLVVMNNEVLEIKRIMEESAEIKLKFEEVQGSEKDAQIESQITKADEEIRRILQLNKTIETKQIKTTIQKQINRWEKKKGILIINSRLFLSALIIKLIEIPSKLQDQLHELSKICRKTNMLEGFKISLKKKNPSHPGYASLIIVIETLIDIQKTQMNKIKEEPDNENYESLILQIQMICSQVKLYLQSPKKEKVQLFKKLKKSKELQELYKVIEKLVSLNTQEKKPEKSSQSQSSEQIEVLQMFLKCLKNGNYQQWLRYTAKMKNKRLVSILNAVNDQMNVCISDEVQEKMKQLENKGQGQEEGEYKKKYLELQKNTKENRIKLQKKIITLASKVKELQEGNKNQSIIEEFQSKVKDLQSRNKSLQQELKRKNQRTQKPANVELEEELNQLREVNEYLTEKIQKMTNQLERLIFQHQRKEGEILRLKTELEKEGGKNYTLQRRITNLNEEIKIKDKMLEEIRIKYEQLNTYISQSSFEKDKETKKKIQNESENSKLMIHSLNQQLLKLQSNEHTLEEINKDFSKSQQKKLQELQKYKSLVEEKNLEIQNMHKYNEAQIMNRQNYIFQLEEILRRKEEAIEQLSKQRKKKESAIISPSAIYQSYDSLISELQLKNQVIGRLEARLKEEIRKRQQQNQAIIRQTQSTILNLESTIRERQSMIEDEKSRFEEELLKITEEKNKLKQSSFVSQKQEQKIQELEDKLSLLNGQLSYFRSSSLTSIDNVIVLLFNILTKYIESEKTSTQKQYVQKELSNIKKQYGDHEQNFFFNLESFAIWFVTNDIGMYRSRLLFQIQKLSSIKQKIHELIDKEIAQAEEVIRVQYEFDDWDMKKGEVSTGEKNFITPPKVKNSEHSVRISFTNSNKN